MGGVVDESTYVTDVVGSVFHYVFPGIHAPDEPMDTLKEIITHQTTVISQDLVVQLTGHTSEVLSCQWNPQEDILASG